MDALSTDQNTNRDNQRPKFQLCFSVRDPVSSRSDIHRATIKLSGISTPIVTPKFYTLDSTRLNEEDEREIEEIMEKLAKISGLGPREKYKEPLLESHRYGWFQEKFIDKNPEIDRIDFPRKTSEMVKIQNLFSQFKAQIGDRFKSCSSYESVLKPCSGNLCGNHLNHLPF